MCLTIGHIGRANFTPNVESHGRSKDGSEASEFMITDANPILEQCATPRRSKQRKPFIVDAPAPMLRRSNELKLSKHARHLYMTMRALANGKTGELRIRDRWLRAEYIGREADMCRNVRLQAMRDLVARASSAFTGSA